MEGDMLKEKGIQPDSLYDRDQAGPNIAFGQIMFSKFLVEPFYRIWGRLSDDDVFQQPLNYIKSNQAYWALRDWMFSAKWLLEMFEGKDDFERVQASGKGQIYIADTIHSF